MKQKRWYVITGAPSSGKTTTLEELARYGYRVVPEAARIIIDEGMARGMTLTDIRADEAEFQRQVLRRKQQVETRLPKEEIIFFDRGMHDSIAYNRIHGFDEQQAVEISGQADYQTVFILDPLPLIKDYARTEDDAQTQQLDKILEQVYREHGYEVVRVPVGSVEERVSAILPMLN